MRCMSFFDPWWGASGGLAPRAGTPWQPPYPSPYMQQPPGLVLQRGMYGSEVVAGPAWGPSPHMAPSSWALVPLQRWQCPPTDIMVPPHGAWAFNPALPTPGGCLPVGAGVAAVGAPPAPPNAYLHAAGGALDAGHGGAAAWRAGEATGPERRVGGEREAGNREIRGNEECPGGWPGPASAPGPGEAATALAAAPLGASSSVLAPAVGGAAAGAGPVVPARKRARPERAVVAAESPLQPSGQLTASPEIEGLVHRKEPSAARCRPWARPAPESPTACRAEGGGGRDRSSGRAGRQQLLPPQAGSGGAARATSPLGALESAAALPRSGPHPVSPAPPRLPSRRREEHHHRDLSSSKPAAPVAGPAVGGARSGLGLWPSQPPTAASPTGRRAAGPLPPAAPAGGRASPAAGSGSDSPQAGDTEEPFCETRCRFCGYTSTRPSQVSLEHRCPPARPLPFFLFLFWRTVTENVPPTPAMCAARETLLLVRLTSAVVVPCVRAGAGA